MKRKPKVLVGVRLDRETVALIDAVAADLSVPHRPCLRADAFRFLLGNGLDRYKKTHKEH